MPEISIKYDEYKSKEDSEWHKFEDPYTINFQLYQLSLSNLYKIKLFNPRFHLLLGFGFEVGVLVTPGDEQHYLNKGYLHLTGSAYPAGGFEFNISSRFSLFAEYHYQWGITTSMSEFYDFGTIDWYYQIEGPMIIAGINTYL